VFLPGHCIMKRQVLIGKNPTSVYENDSGPQEITVQLKNMAVGFVDLGREKEQS